jgi:hypothetical protein
MNQARHQYGPCDDGWYEDDEQRTRSLGVWPLGGTYVHSSEGALNTGPASGGAMGGRRARERDGSYRGRNGNRRHGDGGPNAPVAHDPPPTGRPPLYQVGGRYRGDEWPTDPGFRRGDLSSDADDEEDGAGPVAGYGPPDEPHGEPARAWHGPERRGDPSRTDGHRLNPGTWDSGAWDARDVYGDDRERPRGRASGASGAHDAYGDDRRGAPREPRPRRRPEADDRPRRIRPAEDGETAKPPGGTERGWTRGITPAARVAAVEDAKLLAALQAIVRRIRRIPSLYPRLLFVVVGYAAITSLAAAYAEKVPLSVTASLIVIPAAGLIFNLGMRYPAWGRRALVGWVAGIVATIIYDCLRLALVKVGIWGDPIPGIGRLVLSDPHANFAWGYLWRFLGNGGGMGIAYTMLPWRGWRTGVAYGTLICTGLVGLLYFFPVAQVHFFPLTPVTAIGGYAGHWVYGAVLGWLTSWWLPPVELGRIHGRLTARLRHPGHGPRPTHARSKGTSAAEERFRRAVDRRSA